LGIFLRKNILYALQRVYSGSVKGYMQVNIVIGKLFVIQEFKNLLELKLCIVIRKLELLGAPQSVRVLYAYNYFNEYPGPKSHENSHKYLP
jgi:hypothetical protein